MGLTASSNKVDIHGYCDNKYEAVKEHLESMLRDGAEENVQLCVYVNDKCVIDLYGTAVGDQHYHGDHLQVW